MKKLETLVLLIIFSSTILYGQDTLTTYFDRNWEKCNKNKAIYYRKAYPDSSKMWIVKDYHMNGQLQMLGTYSDKKLKKQQGPAVFYHFNGKIAETGQYINNKMTGVWKRYYSNGELESFGKFTNDLRDSTWTFYYINSKKPFGQINYINGKAEGESKWIYESGRVCEILIYKKDVIISKVNYDEDGKIIQIKEKDSNTEFIGGNSSMGKFVKDNLKYPEELRLQGKEGKVLFHFIVRKDGMIDNVEIQKSDEPLFNEEAMRLFKLIKYMKPARFHGQIVEQECTLPINFKLTY